ARVDEASVSENDVYGQQVIDRESVFAREPAEAAAKRKARDTRVGVGPTSRRQPEGLRFMVELAPAQAGLRPGGTGYRVNAHSLHAREIEDEAVVTCREAGNVMGAATYRDLQSVFTREVDAGNDVRDAGAAGDDQRAAIDVA